MLKIWRLAQPYNKYAAAFLMLFISYIFLTSPSPNHPSTRILTDLDIALGHLK